MLYFLDGDEWHNCWRTLDWTRLPGTTIAAGVKGRNESAFTGMVRVSDSTAVAAEELCAGEFRARKSWLVDGDFILCAGKDIAGPGRVETTVVNLPLPMDAEVLVEGVGVPNKAFKRDVDVSWLWAGNVGYVFLQPAKLHVVRETRQSDWHSIRGDAVGGKGGVETQDYFTAVVRPGADMRSYAYVFCPRRASGEMPALVQSVRGAYTLDTRPHVTSIAYPHGRAVVFREPGTFQYAEVNRSCLMVVEGENVYVADPAWRGGEFAVEADGRPLEPVAPERGRSTAIKRAMP